MLLYKRRNVWERQEEEARLLMNSMKRTNAMEDVIDIPDVVNYILTMRLQND